MISYGYHIRISSLDGTVSEYGCSGFETIESMEEDRRMMAQRIGWQRPRWWQFWRWQDQPRRI